MQENNINFLQLIQDYLLKEISDNDFMLLKSWIYEKPENKKIFEEYLLLYKKTREIAFIEKIDIKNSWEKIESRLNKPNKTPSLILIKFKKTFKYVAVFIAFLGVSYFLFNQNKPSSNTQNQLIIAQESIKLELENGDIKIISADGTEKLTNKSGQIVAEQAGNSLTYNKKSNHDILEYNKLIIPNGKKFQIVLSDGTKIYLNSGTTLKYPVKFIAGNNRQVYLLEGEAYFDVAKDAKHPFIVNSENMNVRVLGTEFNMSSYPEDNSINTVLVEGSVSVFEKETSYDKNTSIELKPGFKASWNKAENKAAIDKVDVSMYTGWVDGKLIFKNTQFKNIIKKLERHYNVTITNNNLKLNEQYFDATFDIETIEQVLNSFNKSYKIEYKIENNQIYIN
ncbi:FecR family protein [Lutibacter maritimus]|uniref:FecR family protein n=1 Tax=Lutibacter maritimus TaxID=593133 RepID=A0A1I6Q9J0_9FLAO|nr:FecR family protein [Lutibacter maritimus]SFS49038.1 FecR family protein [Lutibacter maritimus]